MRVSFVTFLFALSVLSVLNLYLIDDGACQNLVPNNGFDIYTTCPSQSSQYFLTPPWSRVDSTTGTPDYMHKCFLNGLQSIPNNFYGYQQPVSDSGYYGLITYRVFSEVREYLTSPIVHPLYPGKSYRAGFYASLSDTMMFASDHLGAHFSVGRLKGNNDFKTISKVPQVDNPAGSLITDTKNWTLIADTFVASGGEDHITIGNFYDDLSTQTLIVDSGTTIRYGYYYIDEVFLMPMPLEINGPDSICFGESIRIKAVNETYIKWIDSSNPFTILSDTSFLIVAPMVTTEYIAYGKYDTLSHTVTVIDYPNIFLGNDTSLCRGELLKIDLQNNAMEFLWHDGSTLSSFNIKSTGLYYVSASNFSCKTSDSIIVQIASCEGELEMPNIFTPNNDGYNDYFTPVIKNDLKIISFRIFNRWGTMVFSSKNLEVEWDGTCNSEECAEGIYFWIAEFTSVSDEMSSKKGFVHLLK